jgi:hypothetical protein
VRDRGRRGFGAIVWESGLEADEAIRAVKAFQDPNEAIRYVASLCEAGETWAVVDLVTLTVVAQGVAEHSPATV